MAKTNSQDDFLAQVQEAEKNAQKKVEQAKKDFAADLNKLEQKEQAKKEAQLDEFRESQKSRVKDRQVKARGEYEKSVKEGEKASQRLEQEVEPKIQKVLPQVQAYFINELMA